MVLTSMPGMRVGQHLCTWLGLLNKLTVNFNPGLFNVFLEQSVGRHTIVLSSLVYTYFQVSFLGYTNIIY
jgi:hypothetical protein